MGINIGVEGKIIEVMFGGISPSSFVATSSEYWSFPVMDVWIEVTNTSYGGGGRTACGAMLEPSQRCWRRGDDAIGCLVRSRTFWLMIRPRYLWQRI